MEKHTVDRESGKLGKIRIGCENRTQDRDCAGHVAEMAREGRDCEIKHGDVER